MKFLYAAASAAAIAMAAPAAAATTFQLDTNPANTFLNVTVNPTSCVFGSCQLSASLATPFPNFSLNVGESRTFDFARLNVGSGFGVGSATLDAQIGFVLPTAGPAGSGGSASYFRVGGLFTPGVLGGTLTWDTPAQQITAANGHRFTVSFGNLSGAQFGANVAVPVTITLDAVPEPAAWAMMIIGFGAIGGAARAARRPARQALAAA